MRSRTPTRLPVPPAAATLAAGAAAFCLGMVSPGVEPAAGAAPLLAAAGDIACGPGDKNFNGGKGRRGNCRALATSNELRGADAVQTLGDNQSPHGSLANFQRSYDESWGRFFDITRPVIGNHEYGPPKNPNKGAGGYWEYFGQDKAGRRGRGWYSYDLGAWHVVALNTMCRESTKHRTMQPKVGCGKGSPQYRWLKRDLRASNSKCIIAAWHHPRFSSGSRERGFPQVRPLWAALDRAGADIVLNGHDHIYERFRKKKASGAASRRGMRQFTVGTGGRSLGRFHTPEPGSQRFLRSYGVLQLQLRATRYRWEFVSTKRSRVLDAGSSTCR